MKFKILLILIILCGSIIRFQIGLSFPHFLQGEDSGRDYLVAKHMQKGESLFISPLSNFSYNLPNTPFYYWIVTLLSLTKNYEHLVIFNIFIGIFQMFVVVKIVHYFKSKLATIYASILISFSGMFVQSSAMIAQPHLAPTFFVLSILFFIRSIIKKDKKLFVLSIFGLLPSMLTHYSFLLLLPELYLAYLFSATYITTRQLKLTRLVITICFLINLIILYTFSFAINNTLPSRLIMENKQSISIPSFENLLNSFKYPHKTLFYYTENYLDAVAIGLYILTILGCAVISKNTRQPLEKAISGSLVIILFHPVLLTIFPTINHFPQYFYLSCIILIVSSSWVSAHFKSKDIIFFYVLVSIFFLFQQYQYLRYFSRPYFGFFGAKIVVKNIAQNILANRQKYAQVFILRQDFTGPFKIDEWYSGGLYALLEEEFKYPFTQIVNTSKSPNNFIALDIRNKYVVCILISEIMCSAQLQMIRPKWNSILLSKLVIPNDRDIWLYHVETKN